MPAIPNTNDHRKWTRNIPRIAFGILIVFFYLFGLDIPLLGPDEPRYAQVAREMFERGDWVTPTLGGFNWFEKPALLYWLQMASYTAFGVSEFAARFGSALFGLGTVLSLWLLGRNLSRNNVRAAELGNWLAVISSTTIGIIVFSRGASFDIILTFPLTAALVCFFIFDSEQSAAKRANFSLVFFYFFIGVALLAKGLVGVLLPAGIIVLYLALSKRLPSKRLVISALWGTLITAVVASLWYVPMYLRHGNEFINEFFVQHHFRRYTSNKYQHPQPFHFFFWVLPLMTIPWLPFFIGALWKFGRERLQWFKNPVEAVEDNDLRRLRSFAFAWTVIPVLFFSMSGSKLPGYVLPALPGAIVLAGLFIFDIIERKQHFRFVIAGTAAAVFLTLSILLTTVVPKFADGDSVKTLIDTADQRGYHAEKVLGFHALSHNAEFYAAGRLIRESDGRQRKFQTLDELITSVQESGGDALVLTPIPYLEQLRTEPRIQYEFLRDNDELAIAHISLK